MSGDCTLAPPPIPAFDVVSIRPRELPQGQFTFRLSTKPGPPEPHSQGNRYAGNVTTLEYLVTDAYGVYAFQLSGLPDWGTSGHFDMDARSAGEAPPSTAQLQLMLQRMLAERFQLKLHREMRRVPVYALVIANPAKIKEITKEQFDAQPPYARMPGRLPETMMIQMSVLASSLIARPEWMQLSQSRTADSLEREAEALSGLESVDGLKLEARTDSFEVLAIDHVERPSPN